MKRTFKSGNDNGDSGNSNKKFTSFKSKTTDTKVVSGAIAARTLQSKDMDKTVAIICTLKHIKIHP